jgi:8-oxo-dGTP diphosphatase
VNRQPSHPESPRAEPAPILAAGAVVRDKQGRILLVLRTLDPEAGTWSVPGGKVEPGETLAAAAQREVREENGIDISVGRELWTVRQPAPGGGTYEIHDFLASATGGHLQAGDDASDAQWFTPEDMRQLRTSSGLLDHLCSAGIIRH